MQDDVSKATPKRPAVIHSRIKVGGSNVPFVETVSGDLANNGLSAVTMGADRFLAIKKHINATRMNAPTTDAIKATEQGKRPPTHYKKVIKRVLKPSKGDRVAKVQHSVPVSTGYGEALLKYHQLVVTEYDETFRKAAKFPNPKSRSLRTRGQIPMPE